MMEEFCAYTAGLVDSEGCITVQTHKKSESYTSVTPWIFITNTYLPILKKVQKVFGGKIQIATKRKAYLQTCYILYFNGNHALDLLRQIGPFLVLKRKQMKLLFKLGSLKNHTKDKNRRSSRYILRMPNQNKKWHVVKSVNPSVIKLEHDILNMIRKVNKRGV